MVFHVSIAWGVFNLGGLNASGCVKEVPRVLFPKSPLYPKRFNLLSGGFVAIGVVSTVLFVEASSVFFAETPQSATLLSVVLGEGWVDIH